MCIHLLEKGQVRVIYENQKRESEYNNNCVNRKLYYYCIFSLSFIQDGRYIESTELNMNHNIRLISTSFGKVIT